MDIFVYCIMLMRDRLGLGLGLGFAGLVTSLRWGIGRNRDSGVIAGYRRLLDVRSAKNIYRRRS